MLRRSTRACVAAGALSIAVLGAQLAPASASPSTARASFGGALRSHYSSHYDASDTNFTVTKISKPIADSSGVRALIEVTNPSPYLTLTLDNDFLVDADNAAGTVIGASPATDLAINSVGPGGMDLVTADSFTFAAGQTAATVDHFTVANSSGDLSQFPAEVLTASKVTASAPSGGEQQLSGTVTNPFPRTVEPDIQVIGVDSAGSPLGISEPDLNPYQAPANGTASYSGEDYDDNGTTPTAFVAFTAADPFLYPDDQTSFAGSSPLDAPLVAGRANTVHPTLYSNGAVTPLPNETVQLFFRTVGQAPQLAGQGVTGADGRAAISFTAPASAQQAYFLFPGDATYFGANSGDTMYVSSAAPSGSGVIGAPAAPKVTLNPFTKTVRRHRVTETFKPRARVAFTGQLVNPAGDRVQLQELIGKHWRTVASSGALHGKGAFVIHIKAPSKKGTKQFRILVPSDLQHAQGVSKAITLRVS